MKSRILKSFVTIVLVLVVIGLINLLFFLRINRSIDEIVEKRFEVEQQVQEGHFLINQLHNNTWDAMVFDFSLREERIKTLDGQAVAFYAVINRLRELLPEDKHLLKKLRRDFQTYYLMGKDILKLPDLTSFKQHREEISEFRRYEAHLGNLINTTFDTYEKQFTDSLTGVRRHTYWLSFGSVVTIIFGALFSIYLSFRLSGSLVMPIERLTQTVRELTAGNLNARADEGARDEIGRLGASFNSMTGRLRQTMADLKAQIAERKLAEQKAQRRQQQLIQADKMASLGVLVAGMAHEINNPNQFIMSHITPMQKAWQGAVPILDRYYEQYGDFRIGGANWSTIKKRVPSAYANIAKGSTRIKTIVDELRQFVRDYPAEHIEAVNLNEIVASAMTLVAAMVKKSTTNFSLEPGDGIPDFYGHYQRLEQVVVNLVQNACQALTDQEEAIRIKTYYCRERHKIFLEVNDEGRGIEEQYLNRIMDPFFTTNRDNGGTGLGLSISSTIVMDHGGEIRFTSTPEKGTGVVVSLPPEGHPEAEKLN